MISHVLNTAVFGAPLATDQPDTSPRSRPHLGNKVPLFRFYRDLRHSPMTTRCFFRLWGVVYDVSDAYYPNGASKMFTVVGMN